jgi:hypothetical protein
MLAEIKARLWRAVNSTGRFTEFFFWKLGRNDCLLVPIIFTVGEWFKLVPCWKTYMGFICHRFLAVVVQTWVWSKDAMFGFSVPHREKLCAIVRVKNWRFFRKIPKMHFSPKMVESQTINGPIRKCASRAFQWMVSMFQKSVNIFEQFLCPAPVTIRP